MAAAVQVLEQILMSAGLVVAVWLLSVCVFSLV